MHFAFAAAGAVIGALVDGESGFVVGAVLGFVLSLLREQRKLLTLLEGRIEKLSTPGSAPGPADRPVPPPPVTASGAPARSAAEQATAPQAPPPPPVMPSAQGSAVPRPARSGGSFPGAGGTERSQSAPADSPSPDAPRIESGFDALVSNVRGHVVRFFTTGNLVVRVGAVVLLFGVAFLLRYAYEQALFPLELRLAGAALGGLVLTVVGWRLRKRSDTYGLILQGAGVGILYLSIFASARLYDLVPMQAALVLLVLLVAGSSVLAVVQKSQALAILSMSGGFLAPVLLSTGAGSHVALFSYYAVLNGGILAMAWFRSWRWLNWVGFVFTFAIGALWGYEYYKPEHFATTEPFLVLFFLYYIGISVLFARRREVEVKSVVDGTLVFGTPIIAFALQAALVSDLEFGLAFSALGAAVVYVGLAFWMKRQNEQGGLLNQSFVALAVVFATLAIPFAFDDQRFTAASWALEGAGLYWVGLRQQQLLTRAFGAMLQLLAALAFLVELGSPVASTPFLNSAFLGMAILALAGGFTAFLISRHDKHAHRFELPLRWFFLAWGLGWWLAGGLHELSRYRPAGHPADLASNVNEHLFVLFAAVSFATLTYLARRLKWRDALLPGFLLLPIAVLGLLGLDLFWRQATTLSDYGWLAWPAIVLAVLWHLREAEGYARLAAIWHTGYWWFVVLLITWNLVALVDSVLPGPTWTAAVWGAVPAAAIALIHRLRNLPAWPFAQFPLSYGGWGVAGGLVYLAVWVVACGEIPGDPDPLPYVVLLNPIDIVQMGALLLAFVWQRSLPDSRLAAIQPGVRIALGIAGFVWINLVAARAVHFYAGTSFPLSHVFESGAFQTTASILWTGIALALMGLGVRRLSRMTWLVGAALLGVVVVKLFTVDLANLDMVLRIVSFITVGILMLVIGYFAPLPPARGKEAAP